MARAEQGEGEHLLFSFLTCESNAAVRSIHAKAMSAILTTANERETWLTAPIEVALSYLLAAVVAGVGLYVIGAALAAFGRRI